MDRSLKRARELFETGDFEEAERLYERLATDDDADAVTVPLGRLRLYRNRLDDARSLLMRALGARPDDRATAGLLSEAYYREDDFASSARYARAAGDEPRAKKLESFDGQAPYRARGPAHAEIPFVETDPLPLLEVTVNGTSAMFFVDTGGSEIIIDDELALELGLPAFGAMERSGFAGGKGASVGHSRVEDLTLGPLSAGPMPAITMPLRKLGPVWGERYRIDGVVGTVFLYHFLSTIDYPRGRLVLAPRQGPRVLDDVQGRVKVPFWLAGDHFVVARGKVNGVPELLFVDTGVAGIAWTGPDSTVDAARVKTFPEKATLSEMGGGHGSFTVVPALVDELALGAAVMTGAPASVGHFALEHTLGFRLGGMIAHGFFRPYRLTLDFDAMALYLDES